MTHRQRDKEWKRGCWKISEDNTSVVDIFASVLSIIFKVCALFFKQRNIADLERTADRLHDLTYLMTSVWTEGCPMLRDSRSHSVRTQCYA